MSEETGRPLPWSDPDRALAVVGFFEHVTELRVRYAETDQMGVVYHSHYLVWCEVGRTELMRAIGMPYAALEQRGCALAVAEASIRYHAAARYDDTVRVRTTLASVGSRAVTFEYVVENAATEERLATARTTLVPIDRSQRATRLPSAVREVLARYAAS
jgi:acyl-CoA thioester hydrolase